MKYRFKKIYIEITNKCNLKCPFCINHNRKYESISIDNFKKILDKIDNYTNYLYFHLMGEPLLHNNINELINIASKNFYINITTNGYLINNIIDNDNIRQINISLHSYNDIYNISLDNYLNNICNVIDRLHNNTFISLRFWVNNKYTKDIINYLENRYNKKIELINGYKIIDNVFISISKEFIWPSLNNNYYNENGNCYALKDHIGILVNGDVVPCCLDACGNLKLGNIYEDSLEDIINSDRFKKMLRGFNSNKKVEELCKRCNFLDK